MSLPASVTTLAIDGMSCAHCGLVVERVLRSQPGVQHARVRDDRGLATPTNLKR